MASTLSAGGGLYTIRRNSLHEYGGSGGGGGGGGNGVVYGTGSLMRGATNASTGSSSSQQKVKRAYI